MPLVKECSVISKNSDVIVVDYNGKNIQFSYDKSISDKAYVKYENGRYSLTSKLEFEKKSKSKRTKNETVETKLIEDTVEEIGVKHDSKEK